MLSATDPNKAKYQLLINKIESTSLKYFIDSKAFTEYSNDMHDICKIIEEYNINKNEKYWLDLMIWLLICLVAKTLIQ